MTMNECIKSLRMKIADAESPREMSEASQLLEYVYAVIGNRTERFRNRLVSSYIAEKHNIEDQIAIGFNEHLKPDEYAAYQAYRVECKARADATMTALENQLQALLASEL
jgi:hypothetical protein